MNVINKINNIICETMKDLYQFSNFLLKEKAEKTWIQLFRYFFVGGSAFLIDISFLYSLTDFFGIFYLTSAAIAFIMGLLTNYILSISWVFSKRTYDNTISEFTLFTILALFGLTLNEFLLWGLTNSLNIYYLYSKLIAAGIIFFFNFFIRKIILFQ